MDETRGCGCTDPLAELEPLYPHAADWRPRCRRCGRWVDRGRVEARPRVLAAPAAPRLVGPPTARRVPVGV